MCPFRLPAPLHHKPHISFEVTHTHTQKTIARMSPAALILFVSLFLAQAVTAVPVLPRGVPTTVDSVVPVPTSTSTDVPPTPVFTLGARVATFPLPADDLQLLSLIGPSGLPRASASVTTTTQTRSFRPPEMDWLS